MIVAKNFARYGAAREAILEMVQNGDFSHPVYTNKLPPEGELAQRVGVSTGTVREALRILETEGIVSKVHGAGNFYHLSALKTAMRIDKTHDFKKLLQSEGYSVEIERYNFQFRLPAEDERKIFGIEEEILSYEMRYNTNSGVAIYLYNMLLRKLIPADLETLKQEAAHADNLWDLSKERVSTSVEELVPRQADKKEAELFRIPEDSPLISVNETFYSYKDIPIGHAIIWFNPKIMKMHFVRKWS